ncbi:glycoside hydrolase [Schizophyllum commune H4-8]|uniref:glycoside hydrolase n=1 Tax=Schizophyllum commune (strain H4-8 / FGSC 9210) TaxID=578458 RepID=UPI00215E5F8D|nr:glycoside hydrolase [Schizophyllum commune H4-8]KAI5895668.1 glycoside hydrolase [Schizophyllum commune H4-8]
MLSFFAPSLSLLLSLLFSSPAYASVRDGKDVFGVNLGSWLVLEPWMLPQEWLDMGGQDCSDCSQCIRSEFAFVKAYPDTADQIFDEHWSTWFSQDDVDQLVRLGINTVRIPLGYWIIEDLVERDTEFYPRGGLQQLRRGLLQLKEAGIDAILDHHALPGVQSPNQMFTGNCTTNVQFYTPYNYRRALLWTAIMTVLSHLDPAFASVVSIEAVNEPIMDATQTPGYGDFQKRFVRTVRVVERALGIGSWSGQTQRLRRHWGIHARQEDPISALRTTITTDAYFVDDDNVLAEALDIIARTLHTGEVEPMSMSTMHWKQPLVTNLMDSSWQHFTGPNPAEAADGPQVYDNHLYYRQGVADANEEAYMHSICNLQRVPDDAALGNSPLVFGEWGLPTQFSATDEFLVKWADAQKLAYTQGAGWIFWNFKIERSKLAGNLSRQWSYFDGVDRGYLTVDPSQLHDPHVCDPYVA